MSTVPGHSERPRVAIVGGGLAGLAAAAALSPYPLQIELFEARRRLGGRAASFDDSPSGRLLDHGQHVAMGACVALVDLLRRTGLSDFWQPYRRLHFIGPDGQCHALAALPWLPTPLHLLGGLMRLRLIPLRARWHTARTVWRCARQWQNLIQSNETAAEWLARHGETSRGIERFWAPVLTSALGETLDRVAAHAAGFVCRHGLLGSRWAHELYVPTQPLGELFDRRLGRWLEEKGVAIHRARRVALIEGAERRASGVVLADGSRHPFDFVVLAVPWWQAPRLLAGPLAAMLPQVENASRLPAAPITAVHLWFDRPITPLAHAALVGRTSQWLFRPPFASRPEEHHRQPEEHYCQVVISASHGVRGGCHNALVEHVCHELRQALPAAAGARLLRSRVVTEPCAVFSLRPGAEQLRPPQQTAVPNLILAGDWTATGWPSTMEGAVRSGDAAATAIWSRIRSNS